MKRIAAILLVILLIASLGACGKKPAAEPTVQKQELDKQAFWDALDGVWVCDDDGGLVFISFSTHEGVMYYTSGVMFSGAVRSGEVINIEDLDNNMFRITVYYKAVPETMESGAMEEMTKEYTFTMYPDDGYFTIDDIYLETKPGRYEYKGKDLDEANQEVMK